MVKVIDNTKENRPVQLGDIFRYEACYFLIAIASISLSDYVVAVNLTNNKIVGLGNRKWNSVNDLVSYYKEMGATFYDDKDIALCIDDY